MRRAKAFGGVMCALAFFRAAGERDAEACGGCFVPPPPPQAMESVDSIITGERMIFSISKDQTTLYDEITYSGSPASFAWVLPIKGKVTVGLSADIFFATLDQLTASTVVAPPANCPPPPTCNSGNSGCSGVGGFAAAAESPSAGVVGSAPTVNIIGQAQVGPYETVQLQSNDGSALTEWLTANGYNIAASDGPVIAYYVSKGMDFLALKLAPGEGVQAMQPVRVTTPGAFPVLPLRMVGVGTGATTGITIWVVADGRWEPQNFPFFTITTSELTWDWATNSSNYESLRLSKEAALGGGGWQIESSLELAQYTITSALEAAVQASPTAVGGYLSPPSPAPALADAGSTNEADASEGGDSSNGGVDAGDEGGESTEGGLDASPEANASVDASVDGKHDAGKSSDAGVDERAEAGEPDDADFGGFTGGGELMLAQDDLNVLFAGLAQPNARITRLRGDITHSALSADLVIQASTDQSEVSNTYNVTNETGQPLCPVYDSNCNPTGEVPRDQAVAQSSGGCATTTKASSLGSRASLGILAAFAGLGIWRSRRRRRASREA